MWTDQEVATLKKLWPAKTGGMIALRLGKTRNAVMGKADRIGLMGVGPTRDRWTKREIAELTQFWRSANLSIGHLASQLNRSKGACRAKALSLGLRRRPGRA